MCVLGVGVHSRATRGGRTRVGIRMVPNTHNTNASGSSTLIALTAVRGGAMRVAEVGRVVPGSTQRVANQFANL